MAAAYLMASQEKLLQEHIDLEMDISGLQEDIKTINCTLKASFYETGIQEKQIRIDQILMEIKQRALTMGDKPHTFNNSAYCPPIWEHGKGFLNT